MTDSFYQIPRKVHRCADYRALNGNAVKLLNALTFQFIGKNNGDLGAAWSVMRDKHGFKSPLVLDNAVYELLNADLITRTRQGGRGKCSLYALNWLRINPCDGKLEVQPTTIPPRYKWDQKSLSGKRPWKSKWKVKKELKELEAQCTTHT